MKENIIDIIMDIPFFDGLDASELSVLAKHTHYFEIEEGEILFSEGDSGDYVCFVIKGELDILKDTNSPGKPAVIAKVRKNRSIGEMSVIDNTTRSATIKANTKTSIVSLTKKGFDAILDNNPQVGIKILKKIARLISMNLRKTSSRLADYMLPLT